MVTVLASDKQEIDFAPASEYAEIMQNLTTIISTPRFSVPLDRDFGIDADYVDDPVNVAKAKASSAIVQAIRKYESRVTVQSIDFEGEIDGYLKPKVQVIINGLE